MTKRRSVHRYFSKPLTNEITISLVREFIVFIARNHGLSVGQDLPSSSEITIAYADARAQCQMDGKEADNLLAQFWAL